ncbi:MAG TPA: cytochrome c [Acidimicrobiia bacterium]|nr:cytochrome c [Acidimicrobiia bacterium]
MRRLIPGLLALTLVAAACGGGDDAADTTAAAATTAAASQGDAANGARLYTGSCQACHGIEGAGVEGLGKPWVGSDFINSRTDDEMFAFLLEGRPADHPDNTTGIAMNPRGGNPNLTDDDLYDLIAYMRTLNF